MLSRDRPQHRVGDDLPQQVAAAGAVEHADQGHQAGGDRDLGQDDDMVEAAADLERGHSVGRVLDQDPVQHAAAHRHDQEGQ